MRQLGPLLMILILAPAALAAPADHVILVSVDGLRADLLRGLLAGDAAGDYAAFQRLVDEGASTFNARTDYTHTLTLPNHTCMLTGRPVLQPNGQPDTVHHGYTANVDPGPFDTLHNQGNPSLPYVAGVFDVVHDHGLATALYASKSKFTIFDRSWDAIHGAPDLTGADNGRDKIDLYHYAAAGSPLTAAPLHAALMADLVGGVPAFTFVHYRDPDSAGHAAGWGSDTWNAAVAAVDGYLGELLGFFDADPGLAARTVVIVIADHGGTGHSHTDPTDQDDFMIPFFVWGAGIAPGTDLHALNPGRRANPGGWRPDYNAPVPPIRNGGSGNLALALLGLPAVEGSTINADQDLAVTLPASGVGAPAVADLRAQPNPFNARVSLSFETEQTGPVQVAIFDAAGRLVRMLETGHEGGGRRRATWDGRDHAGRDLPSGAYLWRLETPVASRAQKIMLVR